MIAGAGASWIILPRAKGIELAGLSFLLGTALVSFVSFMAGFLFSGPGLRFTVAGFCILIGVWGIRSRTPEGRNIALDVRLLAVSMVLICIVSLLAWRFSLGWDGLFIFEIKARMAFFNGGVVPAAYYSDLSRVWSHPAYPLLLPLTESWIYLWLGYPDQQMVKIIFPFFFVSALAMFFVVNSDNRRSMFVSLGLLMTTPLVWIGAGSATLGYADFPLAVFYLAAIVYLLEYRRTGEFKVLRLSGLLLAAGCWLKREGMVLWAVAMLLMVVSMLDKNEWRAGGGKTILRDLFRMIQVAIPGLAVLVLWHYFLFIKHVHTNEDFLPVTFASLQTNYHRIPAICGSLLHEFLRVRHWGVFWLLSLIAGIWCAVKRRRQFLIFAVFAPIVVYCGTYIFSAWKNYDQHMESSFSRLLLQVSLVAIIMVTKSWKKTA
jgi:hypothetical protein